METKLASVKQSAINRTTPGAVVGWIAAWLWAIAAGGGGLWFLWTKGPWPLTNGWFALLSGVSACPSTGWFLEKYAGVMVSGYVRFLAAAFFFVAGRIALAIGS